MLHMALWVTNLTLPRFGIIVYILRNVMFVVMLKDTVLAYL